MQAGARVRRISGEDHAATFFRDLVHLVDLDSLDSLGNFADGGSIRRLRSSHGFPNGLHLGILVILIGGAFGGWPIILIGVVSGRLMIWVVKQQIVRCLV